MAERKSIKLDRLWLCLTFCGVVAPEGARAGVLELLSRGAHALSSGTCPGYDNSAVARALNQADAPCEPIRPFSRIQGQAEELAQIGNKALGTYEDQFFALLAKQHSRELVCSGSFADSVAAGTPEVLNNIATKMQLMRAAKLQLNRAAQNLESDMDAMTKICPSSMDELKPNPAYAGLVDKTYEYCKVILTSRIAYQTVLSSIPLGGVPPLNDFLDKFANLRDGPEYNQLSSSLNGKIQSLYGQVKSRLLQESQKLDNTVQAEGGAGFSRSARYALLSDPRVISKVVHDGGDDANLEGLACQADAAYGQGADDLSAGLMVGSIAFSGGAGLLARVGSIGWKIGEGAMAARAAGLLSINATRVLQLSALGVNSVTAYSMIDKACFGGSTPGVLANGTDDNGQCVSAPDVRQMAKDSCILDVSLAAIGFAAVVPSKDVRALLAKLKVSGQSVASVEQTGAAVPPPNASATAWFRNLFKNFFKPIQRPEVVDAVKVAAQTEADLKSLNKLGATFHRTTDTTVLEGHVTMWRDVRLRRPTGTRADYGQIIQIDRLPPPGTATGPGATALRHPEMAEYKTNLEAMGYRLTVDSSTEFTGAGAYVWDHNKTLALRPNSTWSTFLHEYQHVEFNHYLAADFASLQATAISGGSIRASLSPQTIRAIGEDRVNKLQSLMSRGLPETAVNETLSVGQELQIAGFRRYIPIVGSGSEKYALRHQITELNALTDGGQTLSTSQSAALTAAKVRYANLIAYDTTGAVAVAAAGATVPIVALSAPGSNRDPNDFVQIIYDANHNAFAQKPDGSWVFLSTVSR